MKTFKKILCTLLVVVMCLTSAPLQGFVGMEWPKLPEINFGNFELPEFDSDKWFSNKASAADTLAATGQCGDNVYWKYNSATGELIISGTGPMYDYNRNHTSPFSREIRSIVVEDGVTSIGSWAFDYCSSLASVTFGNSITSIGTNAFYECTALTSVVIPDSVTKINGSFNFCENLKTISFGKGLKSIEGLAFQHCALEYLSLPASITNIDEHAFVYCYNLINISVDKDNQYFSSDEYGVLFNKDKTKLIKYPIGNRRERYVIPEGVVSIEYQAFMGSGGISSIIIGGGANSNIDVEEFEKCSVLKEVIIPDSVQSIGGNAFEHCALLQNLTIPSAVRNIGDYAFYGCDGLTNIILPEGVTDIGEYAFASCDNLISISLPNSVTSIGEGAFSNSKLTDIIIPNNITTISAKTFFGCSSLKKILLPKSINEIYGYAFYRCDTLENVFYAGTEEEWNKIRITKYDSTNVNVRVNEPLFNATKHYDSQIFELHESNISIFEDIVFLGVNENYKLSAFSNEGIDITDSLTWKISDSNIAEVVSPGCIRTKKNGLITVSAEKSYSERDFCYVYVGDPTHIEYNTVYDQDYYYSGDGFFSNAAQISNAVDIYLSLENSVAEELQLLYDKDPILNTYEDEFKTLKEIEEFTITATVSGNDLSFSKDGYSNTYSETFSKVPIETIADDILMLYPYGLTVSGEKKSYTVKVKIESDDFETIEDTITFSISALESKAANEHIDYLNSNATYKTSLENSYGKNMVKLRNDFEYNWSKYSTFDFDNYYEIVLADLLVEVLKVQKKDELPWLPELVTEYNGVMDKVVSTINAIVFDNYADLVDLDLNEANIVKFVKGGKYRIDGAYVEDVAFQSIQSVLGNASNAAKINKVFEIEDLSKQVHKYFKFGRDTINNINKIINCISVFNAYSNANDSFKEVFEKLYNSIPESESQKRDAIKDFLNYAEGGFSVTAEKVELYCDIGSQIAGDALDTFIGKGYTELLTDTICEWVGMSTVGGVPLAALPIFTSIQAAFGSLTLGLCLMDFLCASSEKAAEMSKIVAMSEFTPYIVETIKYYENNLKANKDNNSVDLFENAFAIHKASQVYVVDHTVKALEIKRDSIIEKLLNREGEYEQVVADTLSIKSQLADMVCHVNDTTSSVVKRTKVVAIKCPVDVLVYDENGKVVVKIINNILEYCADGIEVCISEGEKYICVPATSEYKIVITATDSGNMDYAIFEYDENGGNVRELKYNDISLYNGQNFQGSVDKLNFGSSDKYNLITDSKTIYADEDDYKLSEDHKYTANIVKVTCTSDGIRTYNCSCGDSYTETIKATGHDFEGSICKNCDYDKTQDCSCNCHAGGIKKFFFKFLLFFQKIFKKNKECKCGVYHY